MSEQSTSRVITGALTASGTLADYCGHSILSSTEISLDQPGSVFRLFLRLARGDEDGIVGVWDGQETIAISLTNGYIVKSSSDTEDDDEALALTILEDSLLPRDKLVRAAEHSDNTGAPLARSLFELQLMDARTMVRTLKAVQQRHLEVALAMKEASFTFARGGVLRGKGVKAGPTHLSMTSALQMSLRAALKDFYHGDLDGLLSPLRPFYLRVPERIIKAAGSLGITKRQLHAMEALMDGAHRLADVLQLSAMSHNGIARLVFTLGTMGFLDLLETSTSADTELTEEEVLEALLKRMEHVNHFERLGTHWTTPSKQISVAHSDLRNEYGHGGETHRKGGEIAKLADQILKLVDESWEVLKDADGRRRYRQSILEETQIRFSADLLSAQARSAELQNRYDDAKTLYETAHELHPEKRFMEALKKLQVREFEWLKRKHKK